MRRGIPIKVVVEENGVEIGSYDNAQVAYAYIEYLKGIRPTGHFCLSCKEDTNVKLVAT